MTDLSELAYQQRIKSLESLLYAETHKLKNEIGEMVYELEEKDREIERLKKIIKELERRLRHYYE